jgi:DNA-binding SARP family transcriptional activator
LITAGGRGSIEGEVLRIRILGPMQVHIGARDVPITAERERVVLAMLLLNAGNPVPIQTLAEAVWADHHRTRDARGQVQGCVSRLRRQLVEAGAPRPAIVTDPNGYRITLAPTQLDLHQWRQRWAQARAAASDGDLSAAREHYRGALSLWQGVALAGIDNERVRNAAKVLDEERVWALQECLEIELALGRAVELIPELRELVRQHPYQERLHAALMRALYQAGRQADALAAYHDIRTRLQHDLGVDAGQDLQQLHRAILSHDPQLTPPARQRPPVPDDSGSGTFRPAVPRTLPPDIPDFVGREKELDRIQELLAAKSRSNPPVVMIAGPAGVGKTALSIRAAYQVRNHYPDGQLYIDLRGFDQIASVKPFDVLGRFLRALGVAGASVPATLDERVEVYRGLLSERGVLVVLDNVASEEQAVPLLPAYEGCGVIVNSRARLGGAMGAEPINLSVLDPSPATALVARLVGVERVEAEPEAAAELVRLCGLLPLAIRVAAGRLASRPHWHVAKMVHRLHDERNRLDHLTHGALDVRASIMLSYTGLSSQAQRLLRALGDLEVSEVTPWVAAAVLDVQVPQAEEIVEQLFDAQLIDIADSGSAGYVRYRLHDLVRLFAAERAEQEDSPETRASARTRALASWLSVTEAVHRKVFGGDYGIIRSPAPRWPPDDLESLSPFCVDPVRWFDLEHELIIAMIRLAAREGWTHLGWGLASTAGHLLEVRGNYHEWTDVLEELLTATRCGGDLLGEAVINYRLGLLHADLHHNQSAHEFLHRAATLYSQAGSRHGHALAIAHIAMIDRREGKREAALRSAMVAVPCLRQHRDHSGEALALRTVGQLHMEMGNDEQATAYLTQAREVARAGGATRSEAQVLFWQGMHALKQQRYDAAERLFRQVLDLVRRVGDRFGEAQAIRGLGLCHRGHGDHARARSSLLEALRLIRQPSPTIIEARIQADLSELNATER